MKVASFDVDCQKGFTPICPNELPVPEGDEIVGELNGNAVYTHYRIGSKDCHPPNAIWIADEKHPPLSIIKGGGGNVDVYWPAHCIVGTKGCELLDGLPNPEHYDFFIFKGIEPNLHPYGACYHGINRQMSTGVIEWLQSKAVTHVVVGGLAFDYCVKETALQLSQAGFLVIVNVSASRSVDMGNYANTIVEFNRSGIAIISDYTKLEMFIKNWRNECQS
jgi:nicotinamidase/pyrazinamidase